MRYAVLATDYDGTLATQGHVDAPTLAALEEVRQSGRKLILVSGRHLPDLQSVFSRLDLFDRAVLENGALLYTPETKQERLPCEPPPRNLQEALRKRSVPFSAGRGILATWEPNQIAVLEAIHDLGLDLQVIFNKGAVMVLPSGINKASGLKAALNELSLSFHNVVGVGDAENDHAFLAICECGVAVANALPALKDRADFVTESARGTGVEELIDELLSNDLGDRQRYLKRHRIVLGSDESGEDFWLEPYGTRLVVAGPSGSGKSTFVTALVERLIEHEYQICIIDPEGDYDEFEALVTLGGPSRIPGVSEILEVLNTHSKSLNVNL